MVVYFWLLRNPQAPVSIMPLTALDRLIPFQPLTLGLYLSLWFYVSFAPALMVRVDELLSYGLSALGLSIVGLGLFLLWPTAVPPPEINWTEYPSFQFLKTVDTAGNACPSLHVAFAVFTFLGFRRLATAMQAGPGWQALNTLWCAGICYSTVAIRQHVVLDVIAGAGLGAAAGWAHIQWLKRNRIPLFPSSSERA
jgi:membrane-associated phospholipid phosphatase